MVKKKTKYMRVGTLFDLRCKKFEFLDEGKGEGGYDANFGRRNYSVCVCVYISSH